MKLPETLLNKILLAALLVGIFCVGFIFFFSKSYLPVNPVAPIKNLSINTPTKTKTQGLPVRLSIPEIKVDVELSYVGVTEAGAMDMPKSMADVGWFELGVRPGAIGSAVIAGHFGKKNNIGSAFDNLNQLVAGDKIYIKDTDGLVNTFVVRESRSYDPSADTSEVFLSSDGTSHLNLITCGGTWDNTTKSYSERLVIFTDKE